MKQEKVNRPHTVRMTSVDLKSVLGNMRCYVKLKRLNLVQLHSKVVRLKRCDVSVNGSECSKYIRDYNAMKISEILSKLVAESMHREILMQQKKTKVKKTRQNLFFHTIEETKQPQTPQEFFLRNFHLKPKYSLPKNESLDCTVTDASKTESTFIKPIKSSKSSLPVTSNDDANSQNNITSDLNKDKLSLSCENFYSVIKTESLKRKIEDSPEEESLVPVRAKRRLLDSKPPARQAHVSFIKSFQLNIQRLSVTSEPVRYLSHCKTGCQELVECTECSRKFVKVGHLRRHRSRVHGVMEECSASQSGHQGPRGDIRVTENKCAECSKLFQSPASLRRHIRTEHRGQRQGE